MKKYKAKTWMLASAAAVAVSGPLMFGSAYAQSSGSVADNGPKAGAPGWTAMSEPANGVNNQNSSAVQNQKDQQAFKREMLNHKDMKGGFNLAISKTTGSEDYGFKCDLDNFREYRNTYVTSRYIQWGLVNPDVTVDSQANQDGTGSVSVSIKSRRKDEAYKAFILDIISNPAMIEWVREGQKAYEDLREREWEHTHKMNEQEHEFYTQAVDTFMPAFRLHLKEDRRLKRQLMNEYKKMNRTKLGAWKRYANRKGKTADAAELTAQLQALDTMKPEELLDRMESDTAELFKELITGKPSPRAPEVPETMFHTVMFQLLTTAADKFSEEDGAQTEDNLKYVHEKFEKVCDHWSDTQRGETNSNTSYIEVGDGGYEGYRQQGAGASVQGHSPHIGGGHGGGGSVGRPAPQVQGYERTFHFDSDGDDAETIKAVDGAVADAATGPAMDFDEAEKALDAVIAASEGNEESQSE